MLSAALCSLGFLVAGALSSLVVSTDNINVIAKGDHCGYMKDPIQPGTNATSDVFAQSHRFYDVAPALQVQAGQYAESCYNGTAGNPRCAIYHTTNIPFQTSYVASPFNQSSLLKNQEAIRMDTGLLDSATVFGINSPTSQRLSLRKISTCTPLNVSDHLTIRPMDESDASLMRNSPPLPGEQTYAWLLDQANTPGTFILSSYQSLVGIEYQFRATTLNFYGMEPQRFQESQYATSPYTIPIPSLLAHEADSIYIVTSAEAEMSYEQPVDDPLFSALKATILHQRTASSSRQNVTAYVQDDIASWLGCAEQYQICTAQGRCTSVTGMFSAFEQAAALELTPLQNATLYRFADAIISGPYDLSSLTTVRFPILIQSELRNGPLAALPPNQWELEVKMAQAVVLTQIQMLVSLSATGIGMLDAAFDEVELLPLTPEDTVLCRSQLMRAPNGFSNISLLGLTIILGVSFLIISANMALTNILNTFSLHRSRKGKSDFMLKWRQNSLYQTQRVAFEGLGIDGWSQDFKNSVPIRRSNTNFGDIGDILSTRTIPATIAAKTSSSAARLPSETLSVPISPLGGSQTSTRINSLSATSSKDNQIPAGSSGLIQAVGQPQIDTRTRHTGRALSI